MKRIIKLILIVIISFILFMSIFIIVERILYRKEENRRILSATNSINQSKLKEFRFKPNRKKKLTEHVLPINKNKHNKEKIKKLQEVSARIKNENIIFEKIASDSLKKAREKYNKLPKNKQKVLRDKLTEAAKANDLLTVKKLVHQGVLISDISFRNGNWSGYENFTPIIQATVEGNLEILEYLLKYREFDLQNSKIFLKSQADPELTSGLVEALRNDHPKIAIFLMKSGASHASLPQGCIISFEYTPMYIAINKEYTKVVEYLIMSGIKVDEMHLQKAIETKNSEIENIIRTNLAKENNYDYLIAKNIVMKGQDSKLSVLDSLFTAGLDINFAGGCLLRLACKHNQFEMAKFLLERKADPNQYYVVDKKNRWRQSFNSCDMRSNITALMLACKNINYQIVDLLIKNNADINAADSKGRNSFYYLFDHERHHKYPQDCTVSKVIKLRKSIFKLLCDNGISKKDAFHYIPISYGKNSNQYIVDLVELLIDEGIEINYLNEDHNISLPKHFLQRLMIYGDFEIFDHLIEKNIDLSITDYEEKTLLMYPLIKERSDILFKKLIDYGLDIHAEDRSGNNVLFYLLKSRKERLIGTVKLLIDRNIDCSHKNIFGRNPLMQKLNYSQEMEEVIKLIIQNGADVNAQDKRGKTALLYNLQSPEICSLLIGYGADLNIKDTRGNSLISQLIRKSSVEAITLFLENGLDINKQDRNGKTPLFYVIHHMSDDKLNLLIQKGAKTDIADINGQTPLMKAVNTNIEIVKTLIENGADINAKDNHGTSVLMYAATLGKLEIRDKMIMFLINSGANIQAKNNEGNTAFDFYINLVNYDNLIFRGLGKDYIILHSNEGGKDLEILKLLYQENSNFNTKDIYGNSLMHNCIYENYDNELINYFIENGAKVNIKNDAGNTPFLLCTIAKNWEKAELMLNNGAEPNITNNKKESALDLLLIDIMNKIEIEKYLQNQNMDNELFAAFAKHQMSINFIKSFLQYIKRTNQKLDDTHKTEKILKTKGYDSLNELLNMSITE